MKETCVRRVLALTLSNINGVVPVMPKALRQETHRHHSLDRLVLFSAG